LSTCSRATGFYAAAPLSCRARIERENDFVDKQKKTAAELEEIVKQRIGAGDFKVTVRSDPETGWHASIHGRQPDEVHRCQVMADTIAFELAQHYELVE
jgi:hypothetical protein